MALSDAVCSTDAQGKPVARLSASAADGSSNPLPAVFADVRITNNGGQTVRGRGVFELAGQDLLVYPNGKGWTVTVTVTATDAGGLVTTETFTRALPRCR